MDRFIRRTCLLGFLLGCLVGAGLDAHAQCPTTFPLESLYNQVTQTLSVRPAGTVDTRVFGSVASCEEWTVTLTVEHVPGNEPNQFILPANSLRISDATRDSVTIAGAWSPSWIVNLVPSCKYGGTSDFVQSLIASCTSHAWIPIITALGPGPRGAYAKAYVTNAHLSPEQVVITATRYMVCNNAKVMNAIQWMGPTASDKRMVTCSGFGDICDCDCWNPHWMEWHFDDSHLDHTNIWANATNFRSARYGYNQQCPESNALWYNATNWANGNMHFDFQVPSYVTNPTQIANRFFKLDNFWASPGAVIKLCGDGCSFATRPGYLAWQQTCNTAVGQDAKWEAKMDSMTAGHTIHIPVGTFINPDSIFSFDLDDGLGHTFNQGYLEDAAVTTLHSCSGEPNPPNVPALGWTGWNFDKNHKNRN